MTVLLIGLDRNNEYEAGVPVEDVSRCPLSRNRLYVLEKEKREKTIMGEQIEIEQYSPELLVKYSINND